MLHEEIETLKQTGSSIIANQQREMGDLRQGMEERERIFRRMLEESERRNEEFNRALEDTRKELGESRIAREIAEVSGFWRIVVCTEPHTGRA